MFSQKTTDVLSMLAAKSAQMRTPTTLTPDQQAASAARGLSLTPDASGVDTFDWVSEPQQNASGFAGAFNRLNQDQGADRTPVEVVTDTGVSALGGAVQGLTALAGLADNTLFGGNLGTTGFSKDVQSIQDNLTSPGMRARNRVYGELSDAETRDLDTRGVTGLARIREDMGNTVDLLRTNPAQLVQGTASAGGSLLAGGVVSKGIRLAAGAAAAATKSAAVAKFLAKYGDEASAALGMGGMEAGGAGLQAAQAVNEMSHEQLLANSDFYAAYLENHGDSYEAREAAKRAIGANAANVASLIQAPAALLGGAATSKLLHSPFRAGSFKEALANIGKETLEEGIQEGLGNFSSNVGVRSFADRNQSLVEGVGRGAVEGAAFGGLSAGTMQGPGAAVRGAVATVDNSLKAIYERGQRINEENAVKADARTAETARAAATLDTTPVQSPDIDPVADEAELNANIEVLSDLTNRFHFDINESYQPTNATEERILSTLDPNVQLDIVDVMNAGMKELNRSDATPQEQTDAAILIATLQSHVTDEALSQVIELQSKAIPGGTMARETTKILDAMQNIVGSKTFRDAYIRGLNATPDLTVADVESLETPEDLQAVRKGTLQAQVAPETLDPEVAERLLKHSEEEPDLFTPQQINTLRSTVALTKTVKAMQEEADQLGAAMPELSRVANEVQMYEHKEAGKAGLSVRGHYARIIGMLNMGSEAEAKESLENFRNFAQSMANKLEAVNQSHRSRKNTRNSPASYQAYSQKNGWQDSSIEIRSQNPVQIRFAQQVSVDAGFTVDAFNNLVDQFPNLGVEKVERPAFDPELTNGSPDEVAAQTKLRDRGQKVELKQKAPKPAAEQRQQKQPEPKAPAVEQAATETIVEPAKEAPLTAERVKKAGNEGILRQIALIEDRRDFGTPLPNDAVNLKLLKAERDAREEALLSDPSFVIEDTKTSAKPSTEAVEEVAEPEAKPEVQATQETAEATPEKTAPKIEEVFPNLLRDTNGDQLLINGFTIDDGSRTRLMGENAITATEVAQALQSGEVLSREFGLSSTKLSPNITAAYNKLFGAVTGPIYSKMLERLSQNTKFASAIKSPTNLFRRPDLRLLNILEEGPNGPVINPTIASAMILALTDWFAQNANRGAYRSDEDIAKALDVREEDITDEIRNGFNQGVNSQTAHDNLAAMLTQFLGLKAKSDVKNGLTDGLILSIAAEMLDAAAELKFINETGSIAIGEDSFVNFLSVDKAKLGLVDADQEGPKLEGQISLISQMVLQDPSLQGWDFKPTDRVDQTLQGGGAPTTEAQKAVLKRENAVAQSLNIPMLNVFKKLGAAGVVDLFANGVLSPDMNKNDRLSKDGQNKAFASAYETMMGLVDEMQRAATAGAISLEDVKIFREYAFSSVNRLQQQGQFGDQSSKLTREMITPYAVTADLTDPEQLSMWRRGLAQALGIKIEKLPERGWPGLKGWDDELSDKLDKPEIADAVAALSDESVDQAALLKALKAAGVDSPVALHALQSLADYSNADNLSAFKTHIYVEADGVTDGPTNSLIYMAIGGFDQNLVEGLIRGGIMFSAKPVALHEIFNPQGGDKLKDTYETNADRLVSKLGKHLRDMVLQASPQMRQGIKSQAEDLLLVMNTLLGGMQFEARFEKGQWVYDIGRKQLKNPLTVTVYGSSPAGIAMKIAKEMVGEFYEAVSKGIDTKYAEQPWFEAAFSDPEFLNAWLRLSDTKIVNTREGYQFEPSGNKRWTAYQLTDAKNLTVAPAAIKSLAAALEAYYVTPMVQAIEEGMGKAVDGSKLIQKATNTMSALAKAAFEDAVHKELVSQKANGGSLSEGLSPNELKRILGKVAFLFPYMQSDTITVNVKGVSKGLLKGKEGSQVRAVGTFKGNAPTQLSIKMPTVAGVAGAAYVNISYGDGRMIIQASPNLVGGRLMVFDGINLALKDAKANGKAINASVLEALQNGTPFADLLKNFEEMVQTIDVTQFDDADLKKIMRSMTGSNFSRNGTAADTIQMEMSGQLLALRSAALDEKARQNVLKRVHLSSDHMAALGAPASTEADSSREDLAGLSADKVAARLQTLFLEERAALEKAEPVAQPSTDLAGAFDAITVRETGVRVLHQSRVADLIEGLNIPAQQKMIAKRALQSLKNTDWKIVFGDRKAANAYVKENGISYFFGENDHGLTVPAQKTIIVANNSSETLAHELIHAATLDNVDAYYTDPSTMDVQARAAMSRLELLQIEWLKTVEDMASIRNKDIRAAAYNAVTNVVNLLNAGKQADAMHEFLAWNLSNQELMKLNSQVKVESTFARIAREVVKGLRQMFRLPPVKDDLDSNIRFNAAILMQTRPTMKSEMVDRVLAQSSIDPALADITRAFAGLLRNVDDGFEKMTGSKPSDWALDAAYNLADTVSQNGFQLSKDERSAFVQVIAAYFVGKAANSAESVKLDAFYRETLAQLNQSSMMLDPNSQDPDDQNRASQRLALLRGAITVGTDKEGRSLRAPMFMALGLVHGEARELLNRIEVRDRKKISTGATADEWLKGTFSNWMNKAMDASYGIKPNQKVGEELLNLAQSMVKRQAAEASRLNALLDTPSNFVRNANDKASDFIATGLDKVDETLEYLVQQAQGTSLQGFAETAGKVAQLSVGLMNKRRVDDVTEQLTSIVNSGNVAQELRSMFTELVGVNEGNVDVLGLIKIARASIHKVRQTYRKVLPQFIADEFTRKLSAQEWADLHKLGETDVSALLDQGITASAIRELFADPANIARLRDQKRADIQKLFQADAPAIIQEATDLAYLMTNGRPPHGATKRNALAIANRAGSQQVGSFALDSDQVKAVDGYATMLAVSSLSADTMKSLANLAGTEAKGFETVVSMIRKAKTNEMARVSDEQRFNVPKGYMPYEKLGTFRAVPLDELNQYTKAGYRVVGSRASGAVENLYAPGGRDAVYVATDLSAPAFKQGIMQTVRSTMFGLDALTGASHDNPAAGMITDPAQVKKITYALARKKSDPLLAPIYGKDGQITAYERLVDPRDMEAAIETQANAAVAIGHWMGRQYEEDQAAILNEVLIDRVATMFETDKRAGAEEDYIDLFAAAKTDPVIRDALELISDRDKALIADRMQGKFMVRKNLYEQVIGYRSISVGDFWTGNTRLTKETQDAVANYLTGLLGLQAYRYLSVGEQVWENLMSDARVAIVVKSMLVPAINGLANFYQLMANGMGPVEIARKTAEKLRETHLYSQNVLKHQQLEVKLVSAQGNNRPDLARIIQTEMDKIEDVNKRLSIWPLIEAGEFTQVTEGLTDEDMELTKGRFWDYISRAADKLPPAVKTAGRYAVIAKDTALFEGMARTVAYTDFVAKAVLHEHLTQRKKLSAREAGLRVTNEFVNYDLLGGRIRTKAESLGLIWFWAFKIRSVKVAASMVRNNPLHALLTAYTPGVDIGGTPIGDNAIALALDNRFMNSFGIDNSFRAVSLMPVGQLIG